MVCREDINFIAKLFVPTFMFWLQEMIEQENKNVKERNRKFSLAMSPEQRERIITSSRMTDRIPALCR
jgi:hypothetical protein